jgi:hypothetical protein
MSCCSDSLSAFSSADMPCSSSVPVFTPLLARESSVSMTSGVWRGILDDWLSSLSLIVMGDSVRWFSLVLSSGPLNYWHTTVSKRDHANKCVTWTHSVGTAYDSLNCFIGRLPVYRGQIRIMLVCVLVVALCNVLHVSHSHFALLDFLSANSFASGFARITVRII